MNHLFESCLIHCSRVHSYISDRTDDIVFSWGSSLIIEKRKISDDWKKKKYQIWSTSNNIFCPNWTFFQLEKSILIIRLNLANWVSYLIQCSDLKFAWSLMVAEIDYNEIFLHKMYQKCPKAVINEENFYTIYFSVNEVVVFDLGIFWKILRSKTIT